MEQGAPVDFGIQNQAGKYYVWAYHPVNDCQQQMVDSVTLVDTPLAYELVSAVLPGAGTTVGLSETQSGVYYYCSTSRDNPFIPSWKWYIHGFRTCG